MKRYLVKLLIISFLFLLCVPQLFAKVRDVTVETQGIGVTEKEAVCDALKSAVEQVNGLQISAEEESSLLSLIETSNDKNSEYLAEKSSQHLETKTKGIIKQYSVISKFRDPNINNDWMVTVEVTISKFIPSQQTNKDRLVVIPFRINNPSNKIIKNFSEQLRQKLVSFLTQTRRFAILDREFLTEQNEELNFITRRDVSPDEKAKIGNKLGADFIVIGKINTLVHEVISRILKHSGKKIFNVKCGIDLSYRVINVATGRILLSDSYKNIKVLNGKFCNYDDIAQKASIIIGSQITNVIFPIAVVSVSGKTLYLGQGGKSIHIGQRLKLVKYGKTVTDPYTGESLGREEIPVGIIEVVDVQMKLSKAKIIKTNVNIEGTFEPNRYIVRNITNSSTVVHRHKIEKQTGTKKHKNDNGEKKRKKITEDDW